jgi:chemotaxis protein MotB
MVSYADMITILMAFFVVMYSMAGKPEGEKQEPVMQAFRKQFGRFNSSGGGKLIPRDSKAATMASGFLKKKPPPEESTSAHGPPGDSLRVMNIRQGTQASSGGVIFFEDASAEITAEGKKALMTIACELAGKLQKIEIRGHTSNQPLREESPYNDHWDLAYARCKATMDQLIEFGIDPQRIRMSVAGQYEPAHLLGDEALLRKNGRVEIFMLNEFTENLRGTPEERARVDSNPDRSAATPAGEAKNPS